MLCYHPPPGGLPHGKIIPAGMQLKEAHVYVGYIHAIDTQEHLQALLHRLNLGRSHFLHFGCFIPLYHWEIHPGSSIMITSTGT